MTQVLNTPVSLQAFGFKEEGAVFGCDPKEIETSVRTLIPKVDPTYVFEKDSFSIMSAWTEIASGEPLFISGPHGSGKTSFVNQYCARVNLPVISMTARGRLDRADLVGGYVIDREKGMKFADGPLTRAWRHGCVFLVNEMSAAPPDVWLSVNELLEGAPLYIAETGEVVTPHPRTRIILTDNLRGLKDDEQSAYVGRYLQDPAVMDRFWKMRMDYMSEEAEAALLEATMPYMDVKGMTFERWKKEFSLRLRRAASRIRDAYCGKSPNGVKVDATISTRVLLRFRDLLLLGYRSPAIKGDFRKALRRAMRIALTDALDEAGALAIEKLAELEIADIGRYLA